MDETGSQKICGEQIMKVVNVVIRIVVAAAAYVIGNVIMGVLAPTLHLPAFKPLGGETAQHAALLMSLACPLLIVGLLPLAAHLKGSWTQRCAAIAALLYVTLGLNTLIEAKIFTDVLPGSPWLASLQWILPAVLTAAAITYKFGEAAPADGALERLAAPGLLWRVAVAWLLWPVIYIFFGMCVSPFVVHYYQVQSGALGLHIPSPAVILRTQLLRSAFFLASSLPAIVLWTRSRGRLILALGLAHAMTVGIFPLLTATFFPMTLRIAHGLEITGDSFAYAAVLGLLFARTSAGKTVQHGAAAAAD